MANTTYNIRPSITGVQVSANPLGDFVSVLAPTDLATSVAGVNVTITFRDNTGGDGQHVIFRSSNGTPTEQIGTLGPGVTSFTDIGRPAGVWIYGIKALENGNFSALSQVVTADVIGGATQISHGATFTIVGAGFGTNAATQEFLGGAAGVIETSGLGVTPVRENWDFESQWHNGIVQQDATRGRVLFTRVVTQNGDKRYSLPSVIPENTPYRVSWWSRNVSNMDGATGFQWKMIRVGAYNMIEDNDSEIVFFNWIGTNSKQMICRYDAIANPTLWTGSAAGPELDGGWTKMELFVNTGTQDLTDGQIHLRTKRPNQTQHTFTRLNLQVYGTPARHGHVIFHNYIGNYVGGGAGRYQDLYEDDQYIQVGSWKRVELCNSATYSAATLREDQPWNSWSDTSINITVNKGGLPPGQYFLHVVDGLSNSLFSQEVTLTS